MKRIYFCGKELKIEVTPGSTLAIEPLCNLFQVECSNSLCLVNFHDLQVLTLNPDFVCSSDLISDELIQPASNIDGCSDDRVCNYCANHCFDSSLLAASPSSPLSRFVCKGRSLCSQGLGNWIDNSLTIAKYWINDTISIEAFRLASLLLSLSLQDCEFDGSCIPLSPLSFRRYPVSLLLPAEIMSKIQYGGSRALMYESPVGQSRARQVVIDNESIIRGYYHQLVDDDDDVCDMASISAKFDPDLYVLKSLMKWFKHDFFSWTNKLHCGFCQSKETVLVQDAVQSQPTELERNDGDAGRVEVYLCSICGQLSRFPRYNNPCKLLETRTGRCGEWANCFCLILRSLGYDAWLVVDWTDHVWCEVVDENGDCFHLDVCENRFNCPFIYENGWNKKLKFILSFGRYGIVDSMARYTRKMGAEASNARLQLTGLSEWKIMNIINISSCQLFDWHCNHHDQVNQADVRRQYDELRSLFNAPVLDHILTELSRDEALNRLMSLQWSCLRQFSEVSYGTNRCDSMGRESGDVSWRIGRGEMSIHQETKESVIVGTDVKIIRRLPAGGGRIVGFFDMNHADGEEVCILMSLSPGKSNSKTRLFPVGNRIMMINGQSIVEGSVMSVTDSSLQSLVGSFFIICMVSVCLTNDKCVVLTITELRIACCESAAIFSIDEAISACRAISRQGNELLRFATCVRHSSFNASVNFDENSLMSCILVESSDDSWQVASKTSKLDSTICSCRFSVPSHSSVVTNGRIDYERFDGLVCSVAHEYMAETAPHHVVNIQSFIQATAILTYPLLPSLCNYGPCHHPLACDVYLRKSTVGSFLLWPYWYVDNLVEVSRAKIEPLSFSIGCHLSYMQLYGSVNDNHASFDDVHQSLLKHHDANDLQLARLKFYFGNYLNGLVVTYSTGSSLIECCKHIGHQAVDNERQCEISLSPFNLISKIIVRSGSWVDGLQIHTTSGQVHVIGGTGGSEHVMFDSSMTNKHVCGFYGSTNCHIHSLGVILSDSCSFRLPIFHVTDTSLFASIDKPVFLQYINNCMSSSKKAARIRLLNNFFHRNVGSRPFGLAAMMNLGYRLERLGEYLTISYSESINNNPARDVPDSVRGISVHVMELKEFTSKL